MNCVSGNSSRFISRSVGWAWYEIGSVLLYAASIGVGIVIALADLQSRF